jgi:CRP-like cAMP-binding protein
MMPSALEQFIRSIPLFSLVGPEDAQEVLRLLRPVELAAGEVLFREGEPGKALWILAGSSEVSISSTQRDRAVAVGYARSGDVVGEMALIDDGPRSGTAVVTQGGPAHVIEARDFHVLRGAFVPVAFKILRKLCLDLCTRIRQTNERIVASGSSPVTTPSLPDGPRPESAVLGRFPAFRALPAVVKLALAQKLQLIELKEVTPIFAEGEASDGAWFIVDGEVSVGRNGKTLANLSAGTMFGVVACIDSRARSASCVTTGPATLLRMTERDFDFLFASGHRFAFQMIDLVARQLVQHVREANQLLPGAGLGAGTAGGSQPVRSMLADTSGAENEVILSEVLEVDAALPIDLEFDLTDVVPEGELLGSGTR